MERERDRQANSIWSGILLCKMTREEEGGRNTIAGGGREGGGK